jgi:hypothetical protein
VQAEFKDGRRRHVETSIASYEMGNYHPILMQIGTQTKKNITSSKIIKAKLQAEFQNGNSSACYQMGNSHMISIKIGTRIKKIMQSSKVT